ncbi:DNA polymerase, beta-like region [Candidatus Scalindua japonica]|uniref:DNA polymerase, beta-like region n=1 Tax=Candidatus Scalindua japonica TaxID=1284222 RepID=A0A286TWR5_9BACT|nr:nucleotidyltransferase domain-containing protein [Candidatus Scalindua japonica]GAX60314.1 DNA polymerase, beta-like region [Candidatus Scalindua japonica]
MFGLPKSTIDLLRDYFLKIPEIEKVVIYGSRAKGNYEKGSDIDFAFFSRSEEDLTGKLLMELDELPTPYLFNVTNYYKLKHLELKEHIDRVGIVFYETISRKHVGPVSQTGLL